MKNKMYVFFIILSKPDLLLFSYIQFTFTQTSECFLSNGIKNMHILGSVPELQAVRFGYGFRQKWKKVASTGPISEIWFLSPTCLMFPDSLCLTKAIQESFSKVKRREKGIYGGGS